MPRRVISVALPWLPAEHRLRAEGQVGLDQPFALVEQAQGALRLAGVNRAGGRAGLSAGQSLSDARAICPGLLTRTAQPHQLQGFVRALTRWAERFSPLVGTDERHALTLDATGVAHLFGGEAAMLTAIEEAFAAHGLTARAAIADTRGGAWALAHHGRVVVAEPGRLRAVLADLPVTALRLAPDVVDGLAKVGLTTIEPLTRMPRGALARRFGIQTMRRLDQALGAEPEPLAPARALPSFATRLTLPEPIGLTRDVMAGLERLLERLCADLARADQGARRLVLTARRVDGADQRAEIRLAQPGRDPMRIRALFQPKVDEMKAGYGIDALHLTAAETEPLKASQLTQAHRETEAAKLADLIARLGNRVGFEAITRFAPADSHIPEHAFTSLQAAYSEAQPWPAQPGPARPITLFTPERLDIQSGRPPERFHWRGRSHTVLAAHGPERLAPEWWWDDPNWRTGPRDYWRVDTQEGPRLWLFFTPAQPCWYIQGAFA